MVADKDTRCGFFGCYPGWLQILASKKSFVVVYGLIGLSHFAISSYFSGVISTIEKRFKMPSQTAGLISVFTDFGYIAVIFCSYVGSRSNKPRWVSCGGVIVTIACFVRVLPHVIYGAGEDAIQLAYGNYSDISNGSNSLSPEFESFSGSLCGVNNDKEDCSPKATTSAPIFILMFSQFLLGLGVSSYWSLGIAYMDDNTRKDKTAALVSIVAFIRMFGPTLGFFVASYSLQKFIDPSLKPKININDPRWMGAWWYAWIPLGLFNLILAFFMAFFPKSLPRAAIHQKSLAGKRPMRKKSFQDFLETLKRFYRNKLLIANSCSAICYMFGMSGYWTFLPKYMESLFHQSASRANIVTGSVGLVFTGLGLLTSGALITICKPSAQFLAGWSTFVGLIDAIGHYCFIILGCPLTNFHGSWSADKSWNLTAECNDNCNCTASVKYDPICHLETNTTFYSPCHAGCDSFSFINNSKVFTNCSCAGGFGTVVPGRCPADCELNFILFVILMSFMRFTSSTGRAGNSIIQFRSVSSDDKALAIGLLELLLVLLAFIPGPIIFGFIIDQVCLVWGQTCGKRGNCWLYDGARMSFNFNMTASTFLLAAAILDFLVCWYAKGLKLYDDDINEIGKEENSKEIKKDNEIETEELLVLRACQSPMIVKKADVEDH